MSPEYAVCLECRYKDFKQWDLLIWAALCYFADWDCDGKPLKDDDFPFEGKRLKMREGSCTPSLMDLKRFSGLSTNKVVKSLTHLKRLGYVTYKRLYDLENRRTIDSYSLQVPGEEEGSFCWVMPMICKIPTA